MDAFSITSTVWFNSLSLTEKEELLNGVYSLDRNQLTTYFSCLDKKENNIFLLQYFATKMYSDGFLDVAESIYRYVSDKTTDNYEKATCFGKLGDTYREKMEYEKAYSMYKQSFDLFSKIKFKNKRGKRQSLDYRGTQRYASTISLLRIAEMEFLLQKEEAEKHLRQAKEKIERTKGHEKLSLMWNLACTYRRISHFDQEYDSLDYLASLGEEKRDDLVDKANKRLIQFNNYVLSSGDLDKKKLHELEQNIKYGKLISIAEKLRNSFQFEREKDYLNIALKIENNDSLRLKIAISSYKQGHLGEANSYFENLITSSDDENRSTSYMYLGIIAIEQKNSEEGFKQIL